MATLVRASLLMRIGHGERQLVVRELRADNRVMQRPKFLACSHNLCFGLVEMVHRRGELIATEVLLSRHALIAGVSV